MYFWSMEIGVERAAIEADVNRKTVMSFYRKIRSELIYLDQHTGSMIGGPGKTVEIDETKLVKRKYNRGRIKLSNEEWLVGDICRETKETQRSKLSDFPLMSVHEPSRVVVVVVGNRAQNPFVRSPNQTKSKIEFFCLAEANERNSDDEKRVL